MPGLVAAYLDTPFSTWKLGHKLKWRQRKNFNSVYFALICYLEGAKCSFLTNETKIVDQGLFVRQTRFLFIYLYKQPLTKLYVSAGAPFQIGTWTLLASSCIHGNILSTSLSICTSLIQGSRAEYQISKCFYYFLCGSLVLGVCICHNKDLVLSSCLIKLFHFKLPICSILRLKLMF